MKPVQLYEIKYGISSSNKLSSIKVADRLLVLDSVACLIWLPRAMHEREVDIGKSIGVEPMTHDHSMIEIRY